MTFPDGLSFIDLLTSLWVQGPAAFLVWLIIMLTGRRFLLTSLRRLAPRTRWKWDDVLVDALSPALMLAIVAGGIVLLERILPLSEEWDRVFEVVLAAAVALALVLFIDRACRGTLERLAAASPALQGARGLIQGAVRGGVAGVGLLIFLDSIGISITPLIASLGVGSLAVGLALQNTLANLFAGISIVVDKPIEVGHYVRLEGGEEGFVTRVGWRSTWIRTRSDNMVVIPNGRLAAGLITNFNLPQSETVFPVELGVHYDTDLERAEHVVLEVGREVMSTVPGGVPSCEPIVRYHRFGDSAINLKVHLRAQDFESHNRVLHEFVKRLHARFRRERIVIPYPIRTIDLPAGAVAEGRRILSEGE